VWHCLESPGLLRNLRGDGFDLVEPAGDHIAAPSDNRSDAVILFLDVPLKNRLMMRDPVAETADRPESVEGVLAQILNGPVGIDMGKDRSQMTVPYGLVVALGEHALPENELELRDDLVRYRLASLPQEVRARAVGMGRIGQGHLEALPIRPVGAVCAFDGVRDGIADVDFTDLQGCEERAGDVQIPPIRFQGLDPVSIPCRQVRREPRSGDGVWKRSRLGLCEGHAVFRVRVSSRRLHTTHMAPGAGAPQRSAGIDGP